MCHNEHTTTIPARVAKLQSLHNVNETSAKNLHFSIYYFKSNREWSRQMSVWFHYFSWTLDNCMQWECAHQTERIHRSDCQWNGRKMTVKIEIKTSVCPRVTESASARIVRPGRTQWTMTNCTCHNYSNEIWSLICIHAEFPFCNSYSFDSSYYTPHISLLFSLFFLFISLLVPHNPLGHSMSNKNGIFMSSSSTYWEWGKWTEQSMNKKNVYALRCKNFQLSTVDVLSQVEISRESRLICEIKECNSCTATHPRPSLSAHSSGWGPTPCGFLKICAIELQFLFFERGSTKEDWNTKKEEVKLDIIYRLV